MVARRKAVVSAKIQGRLSERGEVVETSEATIDYLAPGSTRSGGLFFARDPERAIIELRAGGFVAP